MRVLERKSRHSLSSIRPIKTGRTICLLIWRRTHVLTASGRTRALLNCGSASTTRVKQAVRVARRWEYRSGSSIKVEVKKKHLSFGWSFSCFAAHLIERDLLWAAAPGARLRGNATPWFWFFLRAVFIASWRRSLSVPKPAKQNGGQILRP